MSRSNRWGHRLRGAIFLTGGLLAVCLSLSPGLPLARADEPVKPDAAKVAQWIRDLDHAEYRVRSQASKELMAAGSDVLESLAAGLKSGSLERRVRIVDLLGRIYSRGEESSFESAETVLEDVSRMESGSLRSHAQAVLETHYDVRQRLAAASIRKLGGSVLYENIINPPDPQAGEVTEEEAARNVNAVVINQEWTGGDEGLKQIRRLSRLRILYRVKKAPISEEAIAALQADMPLLTIQQRGPAYLGIVPFAHPRGCGISRVQPGSAAGKAGIEVQDIITHFGDQRVSDFEQLIELIGERLPGDTVPITVERNGQAVEVKAELTGWPKESAP